MKKLLLVLLFMGGLLNGYCQKEKPFIRNVVDVKGAIIKKEQGEYTDTKTNSPLGSFTVTYIVDTIQKQLLQVTLVQKKRDGEFLYMFSYSQNKLMQASSGFVQNGVPNIFQTYSYDKEDYNLKEKDLETLSQTEERFALLKESRQYLNILKQL